MLNNWALERARIGDRNTGIEELSRQEQSGLVCARRHRRASAHEVDGVEADHRRDATMKEMEMVSSPQRQIHINKVKGMLRASSRRLCNDSVAGDIPWPPGSYCSPKKGQKVQNKASVTTY